MNEVVLITGTRKGIGRYLVDHYLAQGCTVAGCSREPFEGPIPENYHHYIADVADERAMVDMMRDVRGSAGRGHGADQQCRHRCDESPDADTAEHGAADFLDQRVRHLHRHARVRQGDGGARYGRIVNFATVATPLNLEGEAVYAASKAAVESLTRVAARELAPFNITVNAVGPTPVMTDLIRTVPKQKMDALIATQAIRRMGEHRDITNVIDFFVSRNSDFITGQTVYLGGIN